VNTRVGGFHRAPSRDELRPLAEQLRRALDDALATVTWVAGFDVPDVEVDHPLLAVHDPDRYAIEGTLVGTSAGQVFGAAEFPDHVTETQVPYSTALHARLDGERYLTGPLARYTLNSARLSPLAREAAAAAGLGRSCRNPFRSIVVRAVEVLYAVEEALRLLDEYVPPRPPAVEVPPRAGTGHGISEAPRGLLYHRYELDRDGLVRSADIVPPTAQNQTAIEADLRRVVAGHLHLDDAALTGLCERTIRSYDPCISCSAHFLDLRVERR
jgi:coenzyme F420-reducing hydrogenase alpha subunit